MSDSYHEPELEEVKIETPKERNRRRLRELEIPLTDKEYEELIKEDAPSSEIFTRKLLYSRTRVGIL